MSSNTSIRRSSVIIGAGGALGRALVAACRAAPDADTVFAVSRAPTTDTVSPDPPADPAPENANADPAEPAPVQRLSADPTDPAAMAAAAAAVAAWRPCIHRLIICTGILHGGAADPSFRPEKSLGQLRLERLQQSILVNVWAPLIALEAFAPLLRHADGAVAAALSAMVGSIGDNRLGGWYSYRMSKAALNMGIRNAAIELGRHRHGPIVVAIHPGTTQSELSAPFAGTDRARPAAASAAAILGVLDGLEKSANGRFFNWDGRELPW